MNICIIQPSRQTLSETFIQAHIDQLCDVTGVIHHHRGMLPAVDGKPALPQGLGARAIRKSWRLALRKRWDWEITQGYCKAIRGCKADVVLAEYGPTGVSVFEACRECRIPLVVHFHGFDASVHEVVREQQAGYRAIFREAAAIVAVSNAMVDRLVEWGCPREKVIYSSYGVDCNKFLGASPQTAAPRFLAVGRFVEKKAPHLTILAFSQVVKQCPTAHLCMVGDGALYGVCQDLVKALGLSHAVTFLGACDHTTVGREMKRARAFVQHSVVAINGDSEGTPVAILEAGASGLPVIATRHAGIPDVVIEGKTGLLVDEHDIDGMALRMSSLAANPQLAGEIGVNAAHHISQHYTMAQSIDRLSRILKAAAARQPIDVVREDIERELKQFSAAVSSRGQLAMATADIDG